ncbi:proteasome subunit beta type-4-like isoform X4 [Littorina saxatilis]|uniref:Proteasome subunit beta n=1 Tax=Littorina saxatilis TaxID=31220 RepID=A0AAN9AYC6_9CAEN
MATPAFPTSFVPGPLWGNGPTPGQVYNFPGAATAPDQWGTQRTLNPSVTTTSVLAVKYKDGVVMAADMLGSYGSLARYRNCPRLQKINDKTILGCSGDYADFQFLSNIINQRVVEEECLNDGFSYTPPGLHSWLTRVMYNRRSQFNPLWNTYLVGGIHQEKPFLGYVDKIGIAYEADTIATGFGAYLALPILRDAVEKNKKMEEKQAVELIDRCMKLLFYRDARSLNKYQVAVVTKKGSEIRGPIVSEANWEIAHMVKGYE